MFDTSSKVNELNKRIKELDDNIHSLEKEKRGIIDDYEAKMRKINLDQELELKEKDFEMKHFKDEEMKSMKEKVTDLETKNKVLENENKMLKDIADINGDIIDIKELVAKLIDKLPEINIKSITANSSKE